MSYQWNNSNKNNLPTVTRTSSPTTSTASSSVHIQQTITAPLPPPPPTSSPLPSMRYRHGGGEINSRQIMSHQADRIIPHGHSGKKKRGAPYLRYSSAEINEYQKNHNSPLSSEKQDSGTTSVLQQKRSYSMKDHPLIQDMEMELDFLKGECSTIDIILSSLRTAFLRDGTDTFRNTSSFLPLAASSSSSFSSFSLSSLPAVSSSILAFASSSPSSPSTTSESALSSSSSLQQHQNQQRTADMEREMRVGYDDLMLQVRQLEKKVDSLEYKIKQYSDQHKKSRH